MKRSSIISAVILSAFLLCSCGEAENTSVQTPSQNIETCDLEPLFEYDEDILKSGILGHYKEEIGYDELIGQPHFKAISVIIRKSTPMLMLQNHLRRR